MAKDKPAPQTREDRLAAALRANLKRRKAQARARKEDLREKPGKDAIAKD